MDCCSSIKRHSGAISCQKGDPAENILNEIYITKLVLFGLRARPSPKNTTEKKTLCLLTVSVFWYVGYTIRLGNYIVSQILNRCKKAGNHNKRTYTFFRGCCSRSSDHQSLPPRCRPRERQRSGPSARPPTSPRPRWDRR